MFLVTVLLGLTVKYLILKSALYDQQAVRSLKGEVISKNFRQFKKKSYFCSPLKKANKTAFVAQLDRASHYG